MKRIVWILLTNFPKITKGQLIRAGPDKGSDVDDIVIPSAENIRIYGNKRIVRRR